MTQPIIEIYKQGEPTIWIPVSSRCKKGFARAFLPRDGLKGTYRHGFKAAPELSTYLQALTSIQRAHLTGERKEFLTKRGMKPQRRDSWRHGNTTGSPLLSPEVGWVGIPFELLGTISDEEVAQQIEISGQSITYFKRKEVDPDGPMFRKVAAVSRTFQFAFRKRALTVWDAKCALSGATCALEAAHIKSVSASKTGNTGEMTDPFNSIILNVALHALLDEGLISFTDQGDLLVANGLSQADASVFGVDVPLRVSFHPNAIQYIQHHRLTTFQGEPSALKK